MFFRMEKLRLVILIFLINVLNGFSDIPQIHFYANEIYDGNVKWLPHLLNYTYYYTSTYYTSSVSFIHISGTGSYVATIGPGSGTYFGYISRVQYMDVNTGRTIDNYYATNYYTITNVDGAYADFCLTNNYHWDVLINYNLNYSYTNETSIPLWYEFFDPVSGSNHVGVLRPGDFINFYLNYNLRTNVTEKPFFAVHSEDDSPFPFEDFYNLDWNNTSGANSSDVLNNKINPSQHFETRDSRIVFTNGNFFKIETLTNQAGQSMAKVQSLSDLGDILDELKKMNKKLDNLGTNQNSVSNSIDSTIARWSSSTNGIITTNVAGLQYVLNSINSFNTSGVIASNSISGSPSSEFWTIKIPINGKQYDLKIPIDDQKVLNFFAWLNSFFKLAITFLYYVFCVWLAYKLVTDTLQTPAHTVNGAAIMGTHSNFLIAKACLAVVLVVIATVLQQFLSGLIQAPVNDLFIAWQAQTSSVGFLSESFKLFLKVFPVSFFLTYLGSGLAVFFNFWVFKSTLQIIKNAMA